MTQQKRLELFDEAVNAEALRTKKENQWFDRKSFRIEAKELAKWMIGMANADGGRLVVGIHDGRIEGVNSSDDHLNSLLQAGIEFCDPSVRHTVNYVDCQNSRERPDRLLLIDIEASEVVHRNNRQECFLRVGDENRYLKQKEERELGFDKGEANYDKTVVDGATLADIDMDAVGAYIEKVGGSDIAARMRSRGLYVNSDYRKGVTQAGLLIFGREPPIHSYVRYWRYDGIVAETGTRLNEIGYASLEGTIPSLIEQAKLLLQVELKVTRQAPSGRFEQVVSLPEFAWLEAVVNALIHRSYSLQGDGIRIRQFTDRLEIESPGRLPGLVRVQNIRNARYSKNPHIARVLAEMTDYVRESNEGVKRMFEEMEQVGLREPVYTVSDSSVKVTLYKHVGASNAAEEVNIAAHLGYLRVRLGTVAMEGLLTTFYENKQLSTRTVSELLGVSIPTTRKYLGLLVDAGLIAEQLKAKFDPTAKWVITAAVFWSRYDASSTT